MKKFNFPSSNKPNDISQADWNSWQWQLRNTHFSKNNIALSELEIKSIDEGKSVFKSQSTPYYLSLIQGQSDPIRKIQIPDIAELNLGQYQTDPLAENEHRSTSRLVHRYSDRVLYLVTDYCSSYCRFCTRKYFTGQEQRMINDRERLEAIKYIKSNPGIREVILSGGDPLTLSDSSLDKILNELSAIDHLEILRIGTRMPTVCPMRITPGLIEILKKHQPLYLMTHFNHPRELTTESVDALEMLVSAGIPVYNQTVLLNGINNDAGVLQALFRRLISIRVKPYYIFTCDPSPGTEHLRVPLEEVEGLQRELWGHISGLAMPTWSLDIPNGGGKMTLSPQFEVSRSDSERVYTGWDGRTGVYTKPQSQTLIPDDAWRYAQEWNELKNSKQSNESKDECRNA